LTIRVITLSVSAAFSGRLY